MCPLIGLRLKVKGVRTLKKTPNQGKACLNGYIYLHTHNFLPFTAPKFHQESQLISNDTVRSPNPLTRPLEVNIRVHIHLVAINCSFTKLSNIWILTIFQKVILSILTVSPSLSRSSSLLYFLVLIEQVHIYIP